MVFRETLICPTRALLRLVANGLLGNKAIKKGLEVSDFDHLALALSVLYHRVELHDVLGSRLSLSIKLLLGYLDLDGTCLLRKLVMHNVGDVARVWHFCIVLLLLVYVIVLL